MSTEYLTAEQIAKQCEYLSGQANKTAINRLFRKQDDSDLYPINGGFNVTERAIRRSRQFQTDSGHLVGLEYAYFLCNEIGLIVNSY